MNFLKMVYCGQPEIKTIAENTEIELPVDSSVILSSKITLFNEDISTLPKETTWFKLSFYNKTQFESSNTDKELKFKIEKTFVLPKNNKITVNGETFKLSQDEEVKIEEGEFSIVNPQKTIFLVFKNLEKNLELTDKTSKMNIDFQPNQLLALRLTKFDVFNFKISGDDISLDRNNFASPLGIGILANVQAKKVAKEAHGDYRVVSTIGMEQITPLGDNFLTFPFKNFVFFSKDFTKTFREYNLADIKEEYTDLNQLDFKIANKAGKAKLIKELKISIDSKDPVTPKPDEESDTKDKKKDEKKVSEQDKKKKEIMIILTVSLPLIFLVIVAAIAVMHYYYKHKNDTKFN